MEEKYFADIANILHEAGILKAKEKIVGILEHCLLLERVTDKGYSYRLADPSTLKTKFLFTRKTTLPQDRYNKVMEAIRQRKAPNAPLPLLTMNSEERAIALLIETFINIFPQHEMNYREQQLELSIKIAETEISLIMYKIYYQTGKSKGEIKNICDDILNHNKQLFKKLLNHQDRNGGIKVNKNHSIIVESKALVFALKQLLVLLLNIEVNYKTNFRQIRHEIEDVISRLIILNNPNEWVLWLEQSKNEIYSLSALAKKYGEILDRDLWQLETPIILTSGTMSVEGDFSYLKNTAGLTQQKDRILEINTYSSFDYQSKALLYLPQYLPFPSNRDKEYMQAVIEQLGALIDLTHGHSLVLFTSYRMIEQAFIEISKEVTRFPLFVMGRGEINVLSEFRKSGSGVLFASDSAGEGIDLAGDIPSSLIVVKLPFPIPNELSEYEISLHDNFENDLSESIIPTMLIKLRQWIGRGIRRETDTCVFTIV